MNLLSAITLKIRRPLYDPINIPALNYLAEHFLCRNRGEERHRRTINEKETTCKLLVCNVAFCTLVLQDKSPTNTLVISLIINELGIPNTNSTLGRVRGSN